MDHIWWKRNGRFTTVAAILVREVAVRPSGQVIVTVLRHIHSWSQILESIKQIISQLRRRCDWYAIVIRWWFLEVILSGTFISGRGADDRRSPLQSHCLLRRTKLVVCNDCEVQFVKWSCIHTSHMKPKSSLSSVPSYTTSSCRLAQSLCTYDPYG